MNDHETYMKRCLELAAKGLGHTAPNPMVGSVIVLDGQIIGEGYHEQYGKAHAEVNAIHSVKDKSLLKKATLYVNLEPCSHFGKTPPCADLIVEHKIPYVVIGTIDTFAQVSGRGIEKLLKAGIDVKTGILEDECKELNRRFFTYHEKKRPYIILKWAQTADGFIDIVRNEDGLEKPLQITSEESKALVHQWRNEEQAIMVGKRTALLDNPKLTARTGNKKNPLRIVTDRQLSIPPHYFLMDKSTPTLVFTAADATSENNLEYVKLDFDDPLLPQILNTLYQKNILSVIVEGGTKLINSFIHQHLWDEARVFIAEKKIEQEGVNAPELDAKPVIRREVDGDQLLIYRNQGA